MTMFTRTDKPAEPNAATATPLRDKAETPAAPQPPAATEIRRVPTAAPQPAASASAATAANTATAGAPMTSVISKALKITGQLESTEDIQIEGEIDGDVRGVNVKVGANAKVKGSVYGEEVELSGTVEGKVEARKVVLTRTAHMEGDVIHHDITIQSGAHIAGHLRPEFGKVDNKTVLPVRKTISAAE